MDPAAAPRTGSSLVGTSIEKISQSMKTWRNVTIQISNLCEKYTLANPRTLTIKGYCYHPPQPTIEKNTKEVCSFSKHALGPRGTFGVMTYQILADDKKCVGELAIMFSVPFNYNWFKNWFALGVFEEKISCDENLMRQMYYEVGPFTRSTGTGSTITFTGGDVLLKGTMSGGGHAVIKIEFRDEPEE